MPKYAIHLNPDRQVDADLDTNRPLEQIIADLVAQYRLPTRDASGRKISYALYRDRTRRLGSELTLQQIGYEAGGELLLADWFAPWWETTSPAPGPGAITSPRTLVLAAIIGVLVLACIGGLVAAVLLLLPLQSAGGIGGQAATTSASPSAAIAAARTQTVTQTQTTSAATSTQAATVVATEAPTVAATTTQAPEVAATEAPTVAATEVPTQAPTVAATEAPTATTSVAAAAPRRIQPQHILPEYRNRDPRLFFRDQAGFGAYLWAEPNVQTKVPASVGNIVVSNGDTLEILSESEPGVYQVRVITNAIDANDPKVVGATGWIVRWLVDTQVPEPLPEPAPQPTTAPSTARLRFVVLNYDDTPNCITVRILGISTAGWTFSVDGLRLVGRFNAGGNARLCGLAPKQEVTISVKNAQGVVRGGGGVPSRGSAIMQARWR